MNLLVQHEKVVAEINAYYSFLIGIVIRNELRILKPRNLKLYCQITGGKFFFNFSRKNHQEKLELWSKRLDLLCSDEEKASPFYKFVCSGINPINALSGHLVNKYCDYNWKALEKTHQIREDLIPKIPYMKLLNILVAILAILGLFKGFDSEFSSFIADFIKFWTAPQFSNIWMISALFGLPYIFGIFLYISLAFGVKRYRLQRANNILKYMAICNQIVDCR